MSEPNTFQLDGQAIPYETGQTIMEAARAAGVYIPHLCYHPEFRPHGSCKLCTVKVNGRMMASCTSPAATGLQVESDTEEVNEGRKSLLQMLFVEGNHLCPSCEKSGNCELQALGYFLGVVSPHYNHFYPRRQVDGSHPEVLLDRNRCILCELCVRASREVDGKNVFGLTRRGIHTELAVNAPSGKLGDTDLSAGDRAAHVCPVGAILVKGEGFAVPIGKRLFDQHTISEVTREGKAP